MTDDVTPIDARRRCGCGRYRPTKTGRMALPELPVAGYAKPLRL